MSLGLVVLANGEAMPAPGVGEAEIVEEIGEPTWFSVRMTAMHVEEDFPILRNDRVGPKATLTISASVNDVKHVLCHGPVHGQSIHLDHGGNGTVEIKGGDESLAMDREVVTKVWADGHVADAIRAVLRSHGLADHVDMPDVSYATNDHALVQHDSDLRFVRRMARRYGCWFWLRRDPTSATTHAYVRRPPAPPPNIPLALQINGATPSLDAIDIDWDVVRPTSAIAHQLGQRDKRPIDGSAARSPSQALGSHSLADVAPSRTVRITAATDNTADLQARSEAALIDAGWFIRARGTTTAFRLGGVLRAHDHVVLRGAGGRHSGTYVVAKVRHVVDSSAHRMDFELVRNGWES